MVDFIMICHRVRAIMPHLESAVFWLALTKKDVEAALSQLEKQEWVQACKLLRLKKVEVKLLIIRNFHNPSSFYQKRIPFLSARRLAWWQPKKDHRRWLDPEKEKLLQELLTTPQYLSFTDDVEDDLGLERLFMV